MDAYRDSYRMGRYKKGAAIGYKQTVLLNPDSTFQVKRTNGTTTRTEDGIHIVYTKMNHNGRLPFQSV
ncbi:hypothetical protein [Niabella aurantiaca]|uniref:hypothetical protein n=1 Tax=Niabella aurantiaca TaxID=379900 RepID=UPI0012F94BD5|nr:hypothetical protein [Niabella aurantiaca]